MAKRVVLLIRSLEIGGAERQLAEVARGLHARGIGVAVMTFYAGGAIVAELRDAGVRVIDLAKRGRWDVLPFFFRLIGRLRAERPSVLYCFLPMANVLGALARWFVRVPVLAWGVRASYMDMNLYDRFARAEGFLADRLSRFADVIVCNSIAGLDYHAKRGYPIETMRIVPNGIDTDRFRFDAKKRMRLRAEWGAAETDILIGIVARFDPIKDHETFFRAAAIAAAQAPAVRFVCVGGGGAYSYERRLREQVSVGRIEDRIIWAGEQAEMPAVYSALDIVASSSYGEGFSNSIAEAMACGRICAVTDVGDSKWIVAETGKVVPPRDSGALAAAWLELVAMSAAERARFGEAARRRIEDNFNIARMIEETSAALGL